MVIRGKKIEILELVTLQRGAARLKVKVQACKNPKEEKKKYQLCNFSSSGDKTNFQVKSLSDTHDLVSVPGNSDLQTCKMP